MRVFTLFAVMFASAAVLVVGCGGGAVPPDEALARLRKGGYGEYGPLDANSPKDAWRRAAERYYPPAKLDYFKDMDAVGYPDGKDGTMRLELSEEAVKGRNAWVLWAAGNEAWWDWLARNGYGTIDLLRLVDHTNRATRFDRTGLINEPATRAPSDEETDRAFGVRFARPVTDDPHPNDPKPKQVHVEYRKGYGDQKWYPASTIDLSKVDARQANSGFADTLAEYPTYGYPSGVVGLRLFPNPDFIAAPSAQRRWKENLHLYYADDGDEKGRAYRADPNTIRPFRVGMSCGFCHVAPHPLKPPVDKNFPAWEHLSNNIGNQFMRIRASFGNALPADNYLYHVFDSQLPGAVDTSGYPSDNNNNPNTINSFFGLRGRLARANNIPQETLSRDSIGYIRRYENDTFPNPAFVPRVLLDGSDSVGAHIALSRVYLNIGTHHQQWIRVINPLLGYRKQEPFKLNDIAANSLYWHATLLRIDPLIAFFKASTDPMRLKDAAPVVPADSPVRKDHLRGTGVSWYTDPVRAAPPKAPDPKPADPKAETKAPPAPRDYFEGRQAFAKGCVACHSSVQPGDEPELESLLVDPELPRPDSFRAKYDPTKPLPNTLAPAERAELAVARRGLRLTGDDRFQLTRGHGALPPAYALWARQAVEHRRFWEWTVTEKDRDGKDRPITVHNFLSIDERIPVTVTRTNSARATATNARHGEVWEDFSSETFKELAAVGPIRYRDPFSGAEKTFTPPGDGPGYYRVPTLISIWATAPFLHNNALGSFNNDPSVEGRLISFDDSIRRLLWPERRTAPSKQLYWDGAHAPHEIDDAWYPGRVAGGPTDPAKAADQRAADGGWIWRTTHESWLRFEGGHVPRLFGGMFGLSDTQMSLLPWAPALVFFVLGVLLLLGPQIVEWRERWLWWAWWLLAPLWWALMAVGLLGAVVVAVVLLKFWPYVRFLDAVTQESIWGFRFLVPVGLVGLFLLIGLLFTLHRFTNLNVRRRVSRYAGAAALVLAVFAAISLVPFLSGRGAGVKLGPIPEGTPINTLANIDPTADREALVSAIGTLADYLIRHKGASGGTAEERAARRRDFDQTVGPALLKVSKCPDHVTDRGHDYEFIRRLTDREKEELIALLKTF
jgi:hypothetical protein